MKSLVVVIFKSQDTRNLYVTSSEGLGLKVLGLKVTAAKFQGPVSGSLVPGSRVSGSQTLDEMSNILNLF